MKTKILLLIVTSFFLINLSSCKKKEQPETKSETLTKSKWELYKTETYDLNNNLLNTDTDENVYFDFKTNHELVITDENENDTDTIEWDMNKEENKIYFIDPNTNRAFPFIIKKLEEQDMILEQYHEAANKAKISTYKVWYYRR